MAESLHAAITGLGAAVPDRVLTNADLEKMVDTSDEWITQRTGIKERRVVSDGESTVTLGTAAARDALRDAGLEPRDLDMIICATVTPEMIFPSVACFIQSELGLPNAPAFDISAACSGFVYGLAIADKFIETRTYRRILVLGAETLTRFTDYTDRASCIIFGDGAGAAVVEPTERRDRGLMYSVMHADGGGWNLIHIPAGGSRTPTTQQTLDRRGHYIKMRGRDVYRFAVEKMQWLLGDCMEKCHLTVDDVDLVVPHQVNARIIKSAAAKFKFPLEKVLINIDRYGNTSSASIPLALVQAREAGQIGPGSTVVLVAFGAGLTWAGAVIRL
ncbi:MAG: beta-ketoacyl-ACP synthase III [Phycisphaerae bacterium]